MERRTYAGNCCAFNYVRPVGTELRRQSQYNRTITLTSGVHVNKHGPGFGLVVLLDQQPHDYAFSLHSNMGVHIMVFDPANFPDQTSGAVKEKFIGMGEEMFLSVAPQPNNGLEEMRKYDRRTRNCVFADEISLIYNKYVRFRTMCQMTSLYDMHDTVSTRSANACSSVGWITFGATATVCCRSTCRTSRALHGACWTTCRACAAGASSGTTRSRW